MIQDSQLKAQIPYVLTATDFQFLGEKYGGKVRDNYTRGDVRFLITSDRLSCFDVVVTSIPFKGQVLNQIASYWFEKTKDIVPNHIIDLPDPNVMVGRTCAVMPVEVVVRSYLTGSAWRDYQAGKAISGITLPAGMRASEKLPQPIITPSTKADKGSHDKPISEAEILSSGIVERKLWEKIREVSFALFERGQSKAAQQGLILVDTKYEFGLYKGHLYLVDEIHTLDSSRYWVASTYKERFERGETPEMLDKEPVRQWLLQQGFSGDGKIPEFSEARRVEIARHYVDSCSRITGVEFEAEVGDVNKRIEQRLRNYQVKDFV